MRQLMVLLLMQFVISTQAGLVNHVQGVTNVKLMEQVPAGAPIRTAQQQTTRRLIIGTVVSVNGQVVEALTRDGRVRLTVSRNTRVWKKTMRPDFSAILPGDTISGRGELDAFGNVVATDLWVNTTRFSGQIVNAKGNEYQVREYRTGQTITAVVDSDTVSGARSARLSPTDLQVGRDIETIGLLLPDGKVAATRVYITVNGLPLGVTNPRLLDPRKPPAFPKR